MFLRSKKNPPSNPNDPTYRLFQLLNATHGGTLKDFCVVADVYRGSKDPNRELQHVLRVEYTKNRYFGRFRIYVRSVDKLSAAQLKTYTPAQLYEFGGVDEEKFEKIDPGPFGQQGRCSTFRRRGRSPAECSMTDTVRSTYESYLTQYVLPALEKK